MITIHNCERETLQQGMLKHKIGIVMKTPNNHSFISSLNWCRVQDHFYINYIHLGVDVIIID